MTLQHKQKWYIFIISLILLLAAFLRLYGLTSKGLFFWDEGLFFMGNRFLHWRVNELVENFQRFGLHLNSLHSDRDSFVGYPVFLQKPGHVFLIYLFSFLFGNHDYLVSLESAVFGILCVLLLFCLCRACTNRETGILAAFLLAVSPLHVYYSRVGFHESDAMFFLSLAILLHFYSLRRMRTRGWDEIFFFLSAVSLGCSVICSYRETIFIPLILFADVIVVVWYIHRPFSLVWRVILFVSGFFIPISFAEFLYFVSFYPDYTQYQPSSYFLVLVYKFSTETRFDLQSPLHYVKTLLTFLGLPFLAIAGYGLYHCLRDKSWRHAYLAFCFLLPLLLFSVNTTRVTRAISVTAPFLAILAAIGMVRLRVRYRERTRHVRLMLALVLVSMLIPMGRVNYLIVNLKSGYQRAFDFLYAASDGKHLSTMAPLGVVMFGKDSVPLHPPYSVEDMRKLVEAGYSRYLLVDWQKYVWYYPSIRYIESRFKPIRIFPNPYASWDVVLNENYIPGHLEKLKATDPTLNQIKIYDLNKIFNIPPPRESILVNWEGAQEENERVKSLGSGKKKQVLI